jgi:hypothetical protein
LLVGIFHDRLICVAEELTAVRFVGELGTDVVDDDEGVADASDDAVLVPTEFIAETL